MDSAIFEFYFLYTICFVEQYEFEKIYTTLEDKKLMLNMLNFYNSAGELNQQIEEQLKIFKEIYLQNKLSSNDNREALYDFLCDKRIAQEISQEKAYASDENMEIYRNELIRRFSEGLKKNKTIYKINSDMKFSTISFHSSMFVLNSVLSKNIPLIGGTFESSMIGILHNFIIEHLKGNLIEYKIKYSEVDKINNLLQYFRKNNINPNVRLNSSLLEDWLFKSNELEEDISLFNDFEANLHKIDDYVNQRYTYYLEIKDESIEINIKETIIRNLTEGELNIKIKNYLEDDMYRVPFGSNLKLAFTESQIKEYIQNKYQVFEVKLDLYIPDTIEGIAVNMKYDR